MSIGDKLSNLAVDSYVKIFEVTDKLDDIVHKKKYKRNAQKRRSLSYDREIDEETGCGILEISTENGLITAFESEAPVIRVSGPVAKSVMIDIDNKKGKSKLGKIISAGGVGVSLITPGIGPLIGVAISAGGVYLSAKNQIKNSNKYNATLVSEDCIIFRLKKLEKET